MSVGLICEFNPFHSGHEYILRKIRELTGERVVCVMSGPFVQRAEPACVNARVRTLAALKGGADAVIGLPVRFATSSAEVFAGGAVAVLKNVDDLSALAFGVETDAPDALAEIAALKSSPETQQAIKEELDKGSSYPTAVAAAVRRTSKDGELFAEILSFPNNVLAIEYISALGSSGISPLPIKRIGSGHRDLSPVDGFASATAIREFLKQGRPQDAASFVSSEMLDACLCDAPDVRLFDDLLLLSLRRLTVEEIREIPDVENGLEFRIKKAACAPCLSDAIERIKSKRYTYARLRRIFLHALLGINNQIMSDITCVKTRLLGIKETSKELLRHFGDNIVTRNSRASEDFFADKGVATDALAEDIYSLLTKKEAGVYHAAPLIVV